MLKFNEALHGQITSENKELSPYYKAKLAN